MKSWWRKRREFDEEIASHLAMAKRDRLERGESATHADSAARLELGNVSLIRETTRDAWGWRWLEELGRDSRYGLRMMRRTPGITAVAILTLALGIGANTAIFSLVDAFLLKLLPVKDPQQLVIINRTVPTGGIENDFTYLTFEQFRDRNHSFSGLFARDDSRVSVTIAGRPELVWGDFVSGSYFEVLGVTGMLGRTFTPGDDRAGQKPVAVITYSFWERQFASDPSIVGKPIFVGKIPFTVIGVTPPEFHGLGRANVGVDVILPMFIQPQLALKDHDTFEVIARLKPGVTPEQARADLDVIFQQALREATGTSLTPQQQSELSAQRISIKPGLRGTANPNDSFAQGLRILLVVVGIVLLIACVNIANLLLARGAARQKEIAVRLALGAGRGRLIRQLLIECVSLAVLGGALGLLFAKWSVSMLLTVLFYGDSPVPFELPLDAKMFAFTAGLSVLTGILFGLVPALAATHVDLNPALKGTESTSESHPLRGGFAKSLIVSQVALSLALLVGAGLLLRSIRQLYAVDSGYDRNRVVTMWAFPVLIGYDHTKELSLYGDLLDKLNAIPGVQSASISRFRMVFGKWNRRVWVQGAEPIAGDTRAAYCDPIGPRFFETLGIPLLLGREILPSDTASSGKVAVISESMARNYFPDQNSIGRRFGFDGPQSSGSTEVVGVAKDIKHQPNRNERREAVYIPYTQAPPEILGQINLLFRTDVNLAGVIPAVRREVQSVEPNLPLVDIKTEAAEMDEYLGDERSLATLLSFFGALALGLASIGLYGTMSYAVARRSKELGIRMVLGAQKRDMLWMVLREILSLVAIGVAIGIPVAFGAGRLLASMLFGVKTTDPETFSLCILVMFAIGILAGYLPARKATRVDPMIALRYE
ncbi:MAG: ADOP family duplicated permease [Candidatus Acidiferrales bacterium]